MDSAAGKVYVFVSCDVTYSSCLANYSGVFQFAYNFSSGSSGTEAHVGTNSDGSLSIYQGTFDNAYFTSTQATPTGHLWVCGNAGGSPTLYAITITNGNMGTVTTGPVVSATTTTCSPVTEFCTNAGAACTNAGGGSQVDYIFVSPQMEPSSGQVTGCTASKGCVISYTLNPSGTTATRSGAGAFAGGASGMIVDTQATSPSGTLQLYFGILGSQSCTGAGGAGTGTGGCAIQASQAAPSP